MERKREFGPHRELDTKELYGSSCLVLSQCGPRVSTPPLLCRCCQVFFFFLTCMSIAPPPTLFYIWRDPFLSLYSQCVSLYTAPHIGIYDRGIFPHSSNDQSDLGLRHAPHPGDGDISMMRLYALIGPGPLFQKLWIADRSPWRWGLVRVFRLDGVAIA